MAEKNKGTFKNTGSVGNKKESAAKKSAASTGKKTDRKKSASSIEKKTATKKSVARKSSGNTEKKLKAKRIFGWNREKAAMQKKSEGFSQKMKGLSRKLALSLGIFLLFYVMISLFFSNRFFFRTEINGFSCQLRTVEQVKNRMVKEFEKYELILEERNDQKEVIASQEIGLRFVDDGRLEELIERQKNYQWLAALFRKTTYENAVTIQYDEDALKSRVEELDCLQEENMEEPKAAYPYFNDKAGQYEIMPEELGTQIDKDAFLKAIHHAVVSDQRSMNLEKAGCYVEPAFYSDDKAVIDARDKMNLYLSTDLTYDFGYKKEALEKEQIVKWLKVDKDAQVLVDQVKVGEYVEALSNRYNTCGIRRTFKTPDHKTVTVSGGTYGWRIHYQKEVEQLCEDIKTGEKILRKPIYRQKGQERDGKGNDLHDTYIAISINAQTMWYYKDGVCLLETPVVTGNTTKKMGTPTGVYAIAYKQRKHVLRGDDYESPVDYWMPFYEYRGIGIHDASWRNEGEFGGQIYKVNGSHGCVNTPYQAVKKMFEIVESGTPVVVY